MTTATLPLKPITEDFKEAVAFALSQHETARAFVAEVVEGGLRNVFLVGCGGSLTASYPVHFLLETRAGFPVFHMNSDEFNLRKPALLGEGSSSWSPRTPAPPRRPSPPPTTPSPPAPRSPR